MDGRSLSSSSSDDNGSVSDSDLIVSPAESASAKTLCKSSSTVRSFQFDVLAAEAILKRKGCTFTVFFLRGQKHLFNFFTAKSL